MKGYVDKSACIGCGMCADTAPEAFCIGEDGLAEGYQEIPADSIDNAKEAEASRSSKIHKIENSRLMAVVFFRWIFYNKK